jgi:hypothetical protein
MLALDPNTPGLPGGGVRRSLGVWAAAATAGVGLIARGRLLPTVSVTGTDAWRVGPLDPADLSWLRELAGRSRRPPTAWQSPAPDRCGCAPRSR